MKMKFVNNDKENSESPMGIEPMASQIPVGCSNQQETRGELGHLLG